MHSNKKCIDSMIGLNIDDLEVQMSNVWKMVWEQVLLLALYSRRQYFGKGGGSDAINFRQRMKLIHIMDQLIKSEHSKGLEDVCRTVIAKVESNSGSNEVLEILFDDKDDQKILYHQVHKTKKEIIRDEIEKNGIAFSSTTKDMHYSYYAMYKSLKDLIPLLQLTSSYHEPDVKQEFYGFIRCLIENKMSKVSLKSLEDILNEHEADSELTDEQYIREHLDVLKSIIKTESEQKIISDFYEELIIGRYDEGDSSDKMILGIGEWAKNVFNFTALTKNKEIRNSSDFYRINEDNTDVTVNLNKAQLEDLMHLGLLRSLFDEIAFKSELLISKEKRDADIKDLLRQDKSSALKAISEWYMQNNVGLFIRSNQIPKLIAYLLSFDIEHHTGIYDTHIGGINLHDRGLKGFKDPKKASEKNLQTFLIMKYCLHQGNSLGYLYTNLLRKVNVDKNLNTAEQSIKIIQDLSNTLLESDIGHNDLFEDWGNLLEANQGDLDSKAIEKIYNRMMNRFKRPPKYIDSKKNFVDYFSDKLLEQLISGQKYQTKDKTVTYPFSSNFPLPLWVKI